jgi:hypothetical protein
MMHAKHGFHVCAPHEVEDMKKNGWELDDGKALAEKKAALGVVDDADPIAAARAELDALGIKWDGRWNLKKLQAAKG